MITAIIVAFITGVLGPVSVLLIRAHIAKKRKKPDPIKEALQVGELVNHKLEIIQQYSKADRVWVTQFHNGGNFYPTGKSIKKFSVFYERTTIKAPSVKETFQNIPVSLFPKIFSLLYKEGEIAVPKTSENQIDCGLFPVNGKKYKTKSFYLLPIHDLNNNFIGVLSVSYYTKEHTLTLDEWIVIRQKIGAIGSLLTDYLKVKSNLSF